MSKHCEVCNRTYPDDLDACPYCAEAVEVSEADVVELVDEDPEVVADEVELAEEAEPTLISAEGPDSAVDLGLPAFSTDPNGSASGRPGEGSGVSVIEWASLVEEGPAPAEPAAASFDDPSDADLIGHASQPEAKADPLPAQPAVPPKAAPVSATEPTLALPPAADDEEDAIGGLDNVRSIFGGDASASFARRGPAPDAAPPADDDDSALDLLAPDGPHEVAAAPTPPDSAIDLGADAVVAGSGSHQPIEPVDMEAVDSGIDLATADLEAEVVAEAVGPPPVETSDSGVDLSAIVVEEGSAVPLTADPAGSGIDLTAADVMDSGVDLSAPDEAPEELDVVEIVDSGADLTEATLMDESAVAGGIGARFTPDSDVRPVSDSGIDLSGAEVVAGMPDSGPQAGIEKDTPDTSESGRDLIAEEVESGMHAPPPAFDLAGDSKVGADAVDEIVVGQSGTALAAGQLASEEEEVDLTEAPSNLVDSSAVDLGGTSSTFPVVAPEPEVGPEGVETTRPYQPKAKSIHGEEEAAPSEVDLGARHRPGDSGRDFFEPSESLIDAPPDPEVVDDEDALAMTEEPTAIAEDGLPAVEDELEADEEPAAVEEEEEEEAPAPRPTKEKRRSTAGALLGGVFLGGFVTTAVLLGLWLYSIEPPKEWRGFAPGAPNPGPNAAVTPNNGSNPPPAPVTVADKVDMIKSGDFDRAQKANIEAADESKPDEVAARGEFRVLNYLKQQALNKAPMKADDEALKRGLDDLEKAKGQSDDALFTLGVAKEAINDLDGARKVYQEGVDRFKDDAAKKQRFEDGLNRISAKAGPKPAGTSRAEPAAEAAYLALLLIAFDDPAKPPQPPVEQAGVTGEAGSMFWKAVKAAQDQQYVDAVKELDLAADLHLKRRFTALGKAQNPNSDPTEEIFLRSCEGLKAYWQLQDKLHNSTLPLVKGKDAPAAVDALLADDKNLSDKLTKAMTDADDAKKDLDTAKKELGDAKKDAETAKKDLGTTKKDLDAAKDDLEAKKKDLLAAEKKATDLTADLKAATDDSAKKDETLKAVATVLASAKFIKPDADASAVLPAVKDLVQSADVKEAGKLIGSLRADVAGLKMDAAGLQNQVAGLKNTLKTDRWDPEQMLSFWLPLLRDRGRKDLADDAIIDADRVLKADKGTAIEKAHAHAVKGLALRDQEQYAEAKAELESAKADLPKDDGEWVLETEAALKEASDPSGYFAARAEAYHKEGRTALALAMLGRSLETAAPGATGRLLTMRGTWRLDEALARGKGRVSADDADVAAAQKDADEAKKDGGAEALYLSGRIAEAVGQWDAAADAYRQALTAHAALDADGARYRAALARMLVAPRSAKPLGWNGRPEGLETLAALIAVGVQPGDLGQTDAATKEALKLADEILSAKEGDVPFEARAQAFAIKGLWTQALTTYVDGLRPSLSPEHAAGLLTIIQGHPALRRPTLMTVADPLEAAKHYDAGLRWYNDREYDNAEKEFVTAVEHDGQDARYYYYLGLSRLMQGNRDAYEDFEQGARLERQNRPPRAAVSAALERVQGTPRERLNDVRDRPR